MDCSLVVWPQAGPLFSQSPTEQAFRELEEHENFIIAFLAHGI
jgi:hypothetical protein